MRVFKTFSELINYIPNCLICGKEMFILVEGMVAPEVPVKPGKPKHLAKVHAKLFLKDNILRSKHSNFSMSLDINNNFVIDGTDFVNRLIHNWTSVKKCCQTCSFKITTSYRDGVSAKEKCFPPLTLQSEELHYTLKGGKSVRISKYYNSHSTGTASIRINDKFLQPIALDLNKFRDLEHLNNRLSTIIWFQ